MAGCGGPKEAADPRDILGEDMEYQGVDAREGTGETSAREAGGAAGASAQAAPDPLDQPAGPAECREAAAHLQGVLVAAGKIPAADANPDAVERAARDCVARGDTLREVRCLERAKTDADIDACLP